MANALDFTPKTHSKLIETNNSFVIMSNFYAKENFSCISKKGCNFNNISSGDNILNISNYMMLSGTIKNPTYNHNDFGIVSDPYIKDRYYFIIDNRLTNVNTNLATANTRNYLVIANEQEAGDIQIVAISQLTNFIFERIIDIDKNFLYVVARYSNDTYLSGLQLFKINKTTGANAQSIINLTNTERAYINLIYKDETYFYCIYQYYDGNDYRYGDRGTIKLLRFNKNTNEIKTNSYTIPNYNMSQSMNHTNVQDFYKIDNKYYGIYLLNPNDNQNHLLTICFDSSKNFDDKNNILTFSYDNSLSNINNLKWVYDSKNANGSNAFHITKRYWIIDNYIYLAIYDEANQDSDMLTYQGLHIIKINPDFELEYITKIQFSDTEHIISMCYNSDKSLLLIGYYQSFEAYTYNNDTHLYNNLDKKHNNIICAGFDSLDRLWYQTTTNGVYNININDPLNVRVRFEKLLYTYKNENIHTYITFSAKTYINSVAIGKYIFTLSDNAIFDSTNSNILEIQYTGNDSITYPIIITGKNRVTVNVSYEKEW